MAIATNHRPIDGDEQYLYAIFCGIANAVGTVLSRLAIAGYTHNHWLFLAFSLDDFDNADSLGLRHCRSRTS